MRKMLWSTAFGIAATLVPLHASAQTAPGTAAAPVAKAGEIATTERMLDAIVRRRAELVRSAAANPESRQYAIAFLDRQIAELQRRLADLQGTEQQSGLPSPA